jgi:putative FmdB family regulatory protein
LPIYTYHCQACENVLEKRQSFSEDPLTTCLQCGGALRKVLHPVGIVFKGSGFYNTDYRASNGAVTKDGSDKDPSEKAESKSKDSEASTAAADTSKTSGSGSKSEGEKPAATKSASSGSGATKATASAGSARSE